jgi:hypothetical protein
VSALQGVRFYDPEAGGPISWSLQRGRANCRTTVIACCDRIHCIDRAHAASV